MQVYHQIVTTNRNIYKHLPQFYLKMTIDDYIFKNEEFVKSETPISERDLRAYTFRHGDIHGYQEVVILARDRLSAESLYLGYIEREYSDCLTFGTYNLREITEKPIQEGVLNDFKIAY